MAHPAHVVELRRGGHALRAADELPGLPGRGDLVGTTVRGGEVAAGQAGVGLGRRQPRGEGDHAGHVRVVGHRDGGAPAHRVPEQHHGQVAVRAAYLLQRPAGVGHRRRRGGGAPVPAAHRVAQQPDRDVGAGEPAGDVRHHPARPPPGGAAVVDRGEPVGPAAVQHQHEGARRTPSGSRRDSDGPDAVLMESSFQAGGWRGLFAAGHARMGPAYAAAGCRCGTAR